MTIKQISVFIENKRGALNDILKILREANIQIIASSISDTADFGIYRIITSDNKLACHVLKDNGVSVNLNDVFAISIDNKAGKASKVIAMFSDAGINISYLYSFLICNKGILVFRTDDVNKTRGVIKANDLSYIKEEDLKNLN